MSVYGSTLGSYLRRTAGTFLPMTGSLTVTFWYMTEAVVPFAVGTHRTAYFIGSDPTTLTGGFLWIRTADAAGSGGVENNDLYLSVSDGTTTLDTPTVEILQNQWYHIALVKTGSTVSLRVDGTLIGSVTMDMTPAAPATIETVQATARTGSLGRSAVTCFRSWTAALSSGQIATESLSWTAVVTAALYQETPLPCPYVLTDRAGSARAWDDGGGTFAALPDPAVLVGTAPYSTTPNVPAAGSYVLYAGWRTNYETLDAYWAAGIPYHLFGANPGFYLEGKGRLGLSPFYETVPDFTLFFSLQSGTLLAAFDMTVYVRSDAFHLYEVGFGYSDSGAGWLEFSIDGAIVLNIAGFTSQTGPVTAVLLSPTTELPNGLTGYYLNDRQYAQSFTGSALTPEFTEGVLHLDDCQTNPTIEPTYLNQGQYGATDVLEYGAGAGVNGVRAIRNVAGTPTPAYGGLLLTITEHTPISETGDGVITVVKVTSPTGDPTIFTFTAGGGLSPGTFSLTDGGTQTFDPVTPGSGYSIDEDAAAPWVTTYDVSNGSPVDDITVGSGETVTVTVTNHSGVSGTRARQLIRRERVSPHLSVEQGWQFFHALQLDLETGQSNR